MEIYMVVVTSIFDLVPDSFKYHAYPFKSLEKAKEFVYVDFRWTHKMLSHIARDILKPDEVDLEKVAATIIGKNFGFWWEIKKVFLQKKG